MLKNKCKTRYIMKEEMLKKTKGDRKNLNKIRRKFFKYGERKKMQIEKIKKLPR